MKKQIIAFTGISLLSLLPVSAMALHIGNNADPGRKIEADNSTNNFPAFVFQPSEKVAVVGESTKSKYSISTWHDGAVGTEGGIAYAAASDIGGTYTFDMKDLEDEDRPNWPTAPDGSKVDFVNRDGWVSLGSHHHHSDSDSDNPSS